jgi:O-antigen ligase
MHSIGTPWRLRALVGGSWNGASYRDLIESVYARLPAPPLARWASILLTLSVSTMLISLAASQVFLFAAGAFYAAHLLQDRPAVIFPPLKLPLALFSITTILSVLWAANPPAGWFAVRKLVLFIVWLLAVNLVVSMRHLRMLFCALFLTSAVAGLVATVQFVFRYRAVKALHPDRLYYYLMGFERIHGFMGHWMNFGGQQMLVFAALLSFLLLAGRRAGRGGLCPPVAGLVSGSPKGSPTPPSQAQRIRTMPWLPTFLRPDAKSRRVTEQLCATFWWLPLVMIVVSIVLNFTRGVWLSCIVATVYLVARWRPRWLWALPVLLASAYLLSPSLVRQRVKFAFHPSQDPALSIRLEMWHVALGMMREHPWLGVGPNNIEQVYPLYLPPGKSPEVGYHSHFHNNFLQFGAERGLACLAAWIWTMAALGWHTWKIRRKLTEARWVADAASASWLALLAEGCFEFNFGTSPVLMVFLFLTSTPFVAEQLEKFA